MRKKQVVKFGWDTEDEKEFIDEMGHREGNDMPRIVLLARYLECCSKRSDWGKMDKDEVLNYIKESIEKER